MKGRITRVDRLEDRNAEKKDRIKEERRGGK